MRPDRLKELINPLKLCIDVVCIFSVEGFLSFYHKKCIDSRIVRSTAPVDPKLWGLGK